MNLFRTVLLTALGASFPIGASAIVTGEPAPDANGVVAVFVTFGEAQGYCSGVLLAPNLVLTSRHCVSDASREYALCGQTDFASPYDPATIRVSAAPGFMFPFPSAGPGTPTATEVIVPDGTDVCGNALALLVLEGGVRGGTPMTPRADELVVGETITAFGYGPTGPDAFDDGVRRSAALEVVCLGEGCDSPGTVSKEFDAEPSVACGADGGGPAVDADGLVVGVLIRSMGDCSTGASTYVDVSSWGEFVREGARHAAMVGGYAVPDWADDPETPDMGTAGPDMGTDDSDTGGAEVDAENADIGASDNEEGCSTVPGRSNWPAALLLLGFAFRRRRPR